MLLCAETKLAAANPAGNTSLTVIPVAVPAPLFFTISVKRIVPPDAMLAGAAFVIWRSACACGGAQLTFVELVLVLFVAFGSNVPEVIVDVFWMVLPHANA